VRDHRAAVAVRVGKDTGLQQRQIGVVPSVQRELLDGLRSHQIAQFAARGADDRRVADHRDFLAQPANLQRDVQDERLGDGQLNLAPDVRPETGQFRAQLIRPGRKSRDDVSSFGTGDDRTGQRRRRVPRRERDAGENAAVLILDGTADGGRRLRQRGHDHGRDE